MTDAKQNQSSESLATFAKMVKKQLKKAYNKDARRVTKKIDLHDQPKAVLKVGSGDNAFELWFRNGNDGSVVIDKIVNGTAAGTLKVNTPICHLRTSALLDARFDIPDKETKRIEEGAVKATMQEIADEIAEVTDRDWEEVRDEMLEDIDSFVSKYENKLPERLRKKLLTIAKGIREDVDDDDDDGDPTREAEDFEEELVAPSNKVAIVDASVIEGIDDELAQQAIIVPTKYPNAIFEVTANYDDTILRNLSIVPSQVDEGGIRVVKTTDYAVTDKDIQEGIAPLSHDSSPERRIRKHMSLKQKHHMINAKDVPGRLKDPIKKGQVKRNQDKKDQRKKQRQAEDIDKKRLMVLALLEDSNNVSDISTDDLRFAYKVMDKLSNYNGLSGKASAAKDRISTVLETKSAVEAEQLLDAVEWIRKNPIRTQMSR